MISPNANAYRLLSAIKTQMITKQEISGRSKNRKCLNQWEKSGRYTEVDGLARGIIITNIHPLSSFSYVH